MPLDDVGTLSGIKTGDVVLDRNNPRIVTLLGLSEQGVLKEWSLPTNTLLKNLVPAKTPRSESSVLCHIGSEIPAKTGFVQHSASGHKVPDLLERERPRRLR